MSKTNQTMFVSGDYIPVHICDQCEQVAEGFLLYWADKDFTLCGICLESSYHLLYDRKKPNPGIIEKQRITRELRQKMLERDGHRCRYCGDDEFLTADHVIPESRGGPTTLDNLVTACTSCNSRKGARTPEEAGLILRSIG